MPGLIPHRPGRRRSRSSLLPAAIVMPPALWLLVLQVVPLALIVVYSFARRTAFGGIDFTFTVDNYTRLARPIYIEILLNSLSIALLTTLIALLIGYPCAWYVARQPAARRNWLVLLIIIPFWTNSLILTYAWKLILRADGLVNTLLMRLGAVQQPLELLYTKGAALTGLVYVLLPFMVLPIYVSAAKLDATYIKAAADLGAGPLQTFRNIVLPLTMPGVAAGALLTFILTLELFFVPDVLGGARVVLISNLIQREFLQARNWPFGAALAVVVTGVTLLLAFIYVRYVSSSEGTEEVV